MLPEAQRVFLKGELLFHSYKQGVRYGQVEILLKLQNPFKVVLWMKPPKCNNFFFFTRYSLKKKLLWLRNNLLSTSACTTVAEKSSGLIGLVTTFRTSGRKDILNLLSKHKHFHKIPVGFVDWRDGIWNFAFYFFIWKLSQVPKYSSGPFLILFLNLGEKGK